MPSLHDCNTWLPCLCSGSIQTWDPWTLPMVVSHMGRTHFLWGTPANSSFHLQDSSLWASLWCILLPWHHWSVDPSKAIYLTSDFKVAGFICLFFSPKAFSLTKDHQGIFLKKKFWLHTIKQSRESPSGLIFKQNLMKKKEAFYWKSFWNIPEDNMWYVNNGLIYMSCLFILSITADQLVCLITHPAWSYPKPSRDFYCQANLGFSPAQYFSPVSLSLSFVWHGHMGVTNIYAVPAPCNSTTTAILLGS